MDVNKTLPRVDGRDNMLPRAGESAIDQLRERVQGLEEEPVAATFDDAGEPELEFDGSSPERARMPWVMGGGDVPVRAGIAKVTDIIGAGQYKISEAWSNEGTPELKTNGFTDTTAWSIDQGDTWDENDYVFYVQVQKSAGGREYYIERSVGPGTGAHSPLEWTCPVNLYFDDNGRCIGWVKSPSEWVSPWGVPDPR